MEFLPVFQFDRQAAPAGRVNYWGYATTLNELLRRARIDWHGVSLNRPNWSEHSYSLAFTWQTLHGRFLLQGMLNAYWEPLTFELPPLPDHGRQQWRLCIDTARASPHDVYRWEDAPCVPATAHVVEPRSIVLLAARLPED